MKKIFLFLFMLFVPFVFYAKELKREWVTILGTDASESLNTSFVTSDGNHLAIYSSSKLDFVTFESYGGNILVKYDKDVNILWQEQWGGSLINNLDMTLTKNDELIAVGYFRADDINGLVNNGSDDIVIIKFDNNGKIVWQKSIGGSKSERLYSTVALSDGTYVSSGYYGSTDIDGISNKGGKDAMIIRYDETGNIIWQKSFGGSGDEAFENIFLTKNEEIIACGYSSSTDIDGITNNGEKDALIVKYDKEGNILWKTTWAGAGKHISNKYLLTEDEEIILFNEYYGEVDGLSFKGVNDVAIVKFDKNGNLIWQKSWGGSGEEYLYTYKVLNDGSIILVGDTDSSDIDNFSNKGKRDAFLLKYDKNGNLIWQKSWGGSNKDGFTDIDILNNNEIFVVGYTYSNDIDGLEFKGVQDGILLKYDMDGNVIWHDSFGEDGDEIFSYINVVDNGYVIGGMTNSINIEGFENKGEFDGIFMKYYYKYLLNVVNTLNGSATALQVDNLGIITPKPNEGYEVDKIIVRDLNGDVLDVEVTKLEDGTYSFPLSDDVDIEVLFREKIENPKTGVFDYISFILVGLLISFVGYNVINYNNQKFEL